MSHTIAPVPADPWARFCASKKARTAHNSCLLVPDRQPELAVVQVRSCHAKHLHELLDTLPCRAVPYRDRWSVCSEPFSARGEDFRVKHRRHFSLTLTAQCSVRERAHVCSVLDTRQQACTDRCWWQSSMSMRLERRKRRARKKVRDSVNAHLCKRRPRLRYGTLLHTKHAMMCDPFTWIAASNG